MQHIFHTGMLKWLTFLAAFMIMTTSCSMFRKTEAEKVETDIQKSQDQAMQEIRKAEKDHFKRQPKETRKMMKRSKRMAKKANRARGLK